LGKYQDLTKNIPWKSFGKDSSTSKVGLSLVPVGILPFKPLPTHPNVLPAIHFNDPDAEKYLMNIVGTAIQACDGKLVTCAHVIEALIEQKSRGYILSRIMRDGTIIYIPYPIQYALRYVDPRTDKVNLNVDMAVLIVLAKSTKEIPYGPPNVCWGDSSKLGVGDQVIIGGYPLGKEMFLITKSNRGIVQPSFYTGIVSAVLPATKSDETRIIQVSIPSAGGMSGGAMFDPKTGKVMGMVTSCVHFKGIPQPMTYVVPSEIIAPFVEVITFETKR
jgi:S1-C subfamily serine protease